MATLTSLTSSELENTLNQQRSARLASPIDDFVLFLVGAHGAGKDSILTKMQELGQVDPELTAYGHYRKHPYWTDRPLREGERIVKEPGAIHMEPDKFLAKKQKYLAWYRSSNGFFYAIPPELFPKAESGVPTIPMVHVATENGLAVWRENQTLPHNITAFIHVPDEGDRKARMRARLTAEQTDDDTSVDPSILDAKVAEMSRVNNLFFQHHEWYDVMYVNANPKERGIRRAIYPNDAPSSTVQMDIALRLNALSHLWLDAYKGGDSGLLGNNGRSIATLCDKHVQTIVRDIFAQDLNRITHGISVEGEVNRAVLSYARTASIDTDKLYTMLSPVQIKEISKDEKNTGTFIISITPQTGTPITVQQLLASQRNSPDYHVLRILGQRVYDKTKTRPEYLVSRKGGVIGFACSLTDRQPKNQGENQYHRLEVRIGYPH